MSEVRDLRAEVNEASGGKRSGKAVYINSKTLEVTTPSETPIATGVLEGLRETVIPAGKKGAGKKVSSFYIRNAEEDTLYVLNTTKALNDQLGQPGVVGMYVTVSYLGKKPTKNGNSFHDFYCTAKSAQ